MPHKWLMQETQHPRLHIIKQPCAPNQGAITGGLYYKNLRTHNILQMDRFGSKLVSFILSATCTLSFDKHSSLL